MSSIPSAGRPIYLSVLALSVSRFRSLSLYFLLPRSTQGGLYVVHGAQSEAATGRDRWLRERRGFPGALAALVLHSDGARNSKSGCAESRRLAAPPPPVCILCCREGKGRALPSRGRISTH